MEKKIQSIIESEELLEDILISFTEGENTSLYWKENERNVSILWKEVICTVGLMDVINSYDFPRLQRLTSKPMKLSSTKYLMLRGATRWFPERHGLILVLIPCNSRITIATLNQGRERKQSYSGSSSFIIAIGDRTAFKVAGQTRNNQPLTVMFY